MGAKTIDSGEEQKPNVHKAVTEDNSQQIPDLKKHQDQGVCSDRARIGPSVYQNGTKGQEHYLDICAELYKAILENHWEAAKRIIGEYPRIVGAAITKLEETPLHIAGGAKNVEFVEKLVKHMNQKDLTLQDKKWNTAFCYAAASGDVKSAKIMMQKHKDLPLIRGGQGMTPLYMATSFGRAEMASFLYPLTKHVLGVGEWKGLFFNCIRYGLYDLALEMFEDDRSLAMARNTNQETPLHILAQLPSAFCSQTHVSWINRRSNSMITNFMRRLTSSHKANLKETQALRLVRGLWREIIHKTDENVLREMIDIPSRLLFDAAELGNCQFLFELLWSYPDLLWETNENHQTIFHVAVLNRHASVFNLIHEIGLIKDVVTTFEDNDGNNILHLAATLPPSHKLDARGKLLQLRQELLWFEAVKKIVQPYYMERRNLKGWTPKDLFIITHETLLRDGEHWMKKTAKSCMLVSAIIATGAFIVMKFTVSQGIFNGSSRSKFDTLTLSESIALFSSSISVLTFLSILSTSSFGEMDFLVSLPLKLFVGLAMLFISVATLMVSSCGRLFAS